MKTITIDILSSEAIKWLQDLHDRKLIRLNKTDEKDDGIKRIKKYKGAMTQQSIADVDNQLNELRSEWE